MIDQPGIQSCLRGAANYYVRISISGRSQGCTPRLDSPGRNGPAAGQSVASESLQPLDREERAFYYVRTRSRTRGHLSGPGRYEGRETSRTSFRGIRVRSPDPLLSAPRGARGPPPIARHERPAVVSLPRLIALFLSWVQSFRPRPPRSASGDPCALLPSRQGGPPGYATGSS